MPASVPSSPQFVRSAPSHRDPLRRFGAFAHSARETLRERWSLAADASPPARVWTINGRFLTQRTTGVQRYGREIVHALDEHLSEGHSAAHDLQLDLLVPGNTPLPAFKCINVRRTRQWPGHLWEQFVLPLSARGGILNLCNTGALVRHRQIVCVHDLNFLSFPQSYSFAFRMCYRGIVPLLLKASAGVATVSVHSASELSRMGFAPRERIRIIPNGHEHAKHWAWAAEAADCRVDRSTIVVIGSPAAHKNVDLIIRLSERLASHGLGVAIVGTLDANVFRQRGASCGSKGVVWLGKVTDDELAALYKRCLCLAFPSRAEGFGLPPVEAMALGCPVVSSSAASMPEVCGDGALYADPDDDEAWLHAFLRLKNDATLRATLIEAGHQRAERFSWRESAAAYLEAMLQIDRTAERCRL